MSRALLNDDWAARRPGAVGAKIALDDDCPPPRRKPPFGGGDDDVPTDPPGYLPTLTVRGRRTLGFDDDGNEQWEWYDIARNVPSIRFETRREISDTAGLTLVVAEVQIPYAQTSTPIHETAAAQTSDGMVWRVRATKRAATTYSLTMERVDGEPSPDYLFGGPGG